MSQSDADPVDTLRPAAETAVTQCLNLQQSESCAIVTDDKRLRIGEILYDVASEITADSVLLRYPPGETHGSEPPAPVATAMAGSDVVLAPTSKSITHTRARSEANDAGARIATLPGITEEVFATGLDVDYEAIARHCSKLLDQLEDATNIRVTTDAGTDLTIDVGDRQFLSDTGIVHESGKLSNLPAGEVFVSPESGDGTVVIDGTMHPHGLLDADQSITIEITDGLVTSISDDELRTIVEDAAEDVGDGAYNLAELGIGTNLAVTDLVGSVLLDEKAAGTIHVAIGDDAGIGGDTDAPIHMDGIIRDPRVFVDGVEIELPTS